MQIVDTRMNFQQIFKTCGKGFTVVCEMTAVTGANLRSGEAYWELSGPVTINRLTSCRACRQSIMKGASAMVRFYFLLIIWYVRFMICLVDHFIYICIS